MASKWWGQYLNSGSLRTELVLIAIGLYSALTFLWSTFLSLVPPPPPRPRFHMGFRMPSEKWLCLEPGNGKGIQSHAFQAPFKFYSYCEESCIPTENMSDWEKIITKGLQKDLWNLDPIFIFHKPKASFPKSQNKTNIFIKNCFDTIALCMTGQAFPLSL